MERAALSDEGETGYRVGEVSMSTDTHNDTEDAHRWRQIATLMREIDAATRGIQTSNASDDELLDTALKMIHGFQAAVDAKCRHGWTVGLVECIDDAAEKIIQRDRLLDVFKAINNVAGPNPWLKRMREAIEQMEHNDGESMLDLLDMALDARGTVDDLNGVWDTTGPDEGGATDETGDCDG